MAELFEPANIRKTSAESQGLSSLTFSDILSSNQPSLARQALQSAAYAAIETPANAVAQMFSREKPLDLISPIKPAEFNTLDWYAQTAGSAVGQIVPLMVAARTGKGLGSCLLLGGERCALTRALTLNLTSSQAMRMTTPFLEAAATGAIAEGLLRPVDLSKGDQLSQRLSNSSMGAGTFTLLAAGTKILKGLDAKYLSQDCPWMVNTWKHDALRHAIAGAGVGLANAEMHALVTEGRDATGKELYQSAYTFSLLGGGFRVAGEAFGQAQGTKTASDVIAQNRGLQEVMRDSTQGHSLMLEYGDARVNNPGGALPTADAAAFRQAGHLAGAMALAEARANVAPGQRWEDVFQKKMLEDQATGGHGFNRITGAYGRFSECLPIRNWEQNRFALIREKAFLKDLMNNNGETPVLQEMNQGWNSRWSGQVDPAQELMASMSRTFNANDQDQAGRAQYQDQMASTAHKKTGVVLSNIDANKHQILFDIGSAEGQVPSNIANLSGQRTTAFAVELDPGSFLNMLRLKRQADQGTGDFAAIPVFANGVSLRLPGRSVDLFSSLSNVHELISYGREFYGPYRPENAQLALKNWSNGLRDGGNIIVKDFLRPDELGANVLLIPREVGTPENPTMHNIDGQPVDAEYHTGRPGEVFVEEFTGVRPWRASENGVPYPRFETLHFAGKDFQVEWVDLNGERAMSLSAKDAAEIMASARYGMLAQRSQMRGVVDEQFIHFTRDGWEQLMDSSSGFGSRLSPVPESVVTGAGPDYVQHRNKFFEMRDPQGNPVNLSAENTHWDTTYQEVFQKLPDQGRGSLDFFGTRSLPLLPLTGNRLVPQEPSAQDDDWKRKQAS